MVVDDGARRLGGFHDVDLSRGLVPIGVPNHPVGHRFEAMIANDAHLADREIAQTLETGIIGVAGVHGQILGHQFRHPTSYLRGNYRK